MKAFIDNKDGYYQFDGDNYPRWACGMSEVLPINFPPPINPRIAEIKAELYTIDAKSIRPIREGDKDRLNALEEQAVVLREELRGIQ